MTLSKLSHKLT